MTTGVAQSPQGGTTVEVTRGASAEPVGAMTRAIAWILDAVLVNLVAIITGIGVELILSMIPISKDLSSVLKPLAAVVYAVWAAAYFVVFWSVAGQTPGARVMQIRLVPARGGRVKPVRALIRWVGMNAAMLMLFLGYVPVLVGRRPLPDWLAHTLVVDAPETSLASTRRATRDAARASAAEAASAAEVASNAGERPRQP
jgi:uncharacterized RDD family membrane protein YckC